MRAGFREHVVDAYCKRSEEMDVGISRLALFLDPRYKAGVSTDTFKDLVQLACMLARKWCWSEEDAQALVSAMTNYNAGLAPYDLEWDGKTFNLRAWWSSISAATSEAKLLCTIALALADICPHAAAPERVFSAMGWYEGSRRNALGTETTGMLASIKMHYVHHPTERL
mgnify:FL=1